MFVHGSLQTLSNGDLFSAWQKEPKINQTLEILQMLIIFAILKSGLCLTKE